MFLHNETVAFSTHTRSLLNFGKNSYLDYMPKKVDVLQKKTICHAYI